MQNHIGLSKSNIKELKRGFHAMKFGSLRLNFIQNTKHLKIRIRFQTGIFFVRLSRRIDQILIENDHISVQSYLKYY